MNKTCNGMNLADVYALACDAIAHEGARAYFPELNPRSFDAPSALCEYMWANPTQWRAATDEGSWEFIGDIAWRVKLLEFAETVFGATVS